MSDLERFDIYDGDYRHEKDFRDDGDYCNYDDAEKIIKDLEQKLADAEKVTQELSDFHLRYGLAIDSTYGNKARKLIGRLESPPQEGK